MNSLDHQGLCRIHLRNFKGIGPQGADIPIRPITLLFGANSAGKSTVLQALHYLRDVLERRNANPDATISGGAKQDLGGFRSLVHNHDLSESITVGIEIRPRDDDAFWDYLPLELLSSEQQNFVSICELSRIYDIKKIGLEVTTAWNGHRNTATVVAYSVSINGNPLLSLTRSEPEKPDRKSPEFKARVVFDDDTLCRFLAKRWVEQTDEVMGDYDLPAMDPMSDVPEDWSESCLPTWGRSIALPVSAPIEPDTVNVAELLRMTLSQMLEGIGRRVLAELQQIRYIGPWRTVPDRQFRVPRVQDEARWSDGLGAWDSLARAAESSDPGKLIPSVNEWLGSENKLATDYRIESRREILLDSDGSIVKAIQRFAVAYDDLGPTDFSTLIWQPLLAQARQQRLTIISRSTGLPLSPADIGVGISQVIPLIVAAHLGDKKTVAIEQPELHIHPAMQVALGDLVIDAARRRNITSIMETHSEHLVLRLLRRIRETENSELNDPPFALAPDDISIVYVSAGPNGMNVTVLPVDPEGEFTVRWPNKNGFFGERAEELF